jgi:undecaprenyl-diphosphatase
MLMVLKSILLGIIQGLTEFLPISSSGHLVLFEQFMGFEQPGILYEVLLHCATLVAIIIIFAKRIGRIIASLFRPWSLQDENFRMLAYIVLASVPAALVGIFLKRYIERLFSNVYLVAVMLLVTGGVLFSTRFVRTKPDGKPSVLSSIIIGLGQAFAILPGVSRSGTTIAAGLWSGLSREGAAEFSFILAIPAILGATILQLKELGQAANAGMLGVYLSGALAAFVSGFAALMVLIRIVKRGRLHYFAYYCWIAAFVAVVLKIFLLQ